MTVIRGFIPEQEATHTLRWCEPGYRWSPGVSTFKTATGKLGLHLVCFLSRFRTRCGMRAQHFSVIVYLALALPGCGGSDQQQAPTTAPSPPSATSLKFQTVVQSLTAPLYLAAPPGDASHVFVVEQGGTVRLLDMPSGSLQTSPFLDITGLVLSGGERGLLGLAFDPGYAANWRVDVFDADVNGDIVIARYVRNALNGNIADPGSAVPLVTISHPTFSNHNGGMLTFGPDGCLYAGVGDGGGAGDPDNHA